jgi:hypothetical protein
VFVVGCLWFVGRELSRRLKGKGPTTNNRQQTTINNAQKKESFRRGVEAFCFVSGPQVGAKAQNV